MKEGVADSRPEGQNHMQILVVITLLCSIEQVPIRLEPMPREFEVEVESGPGGPMGGSTARRSSLDGGRPRSRDNLGPASDPPSNPLSAYLPPKPHAPRRAMRHTPRRGSRHDSPPRKHALPEPPATVSGAWWRLLRAGRMSSGRTCVPCTRQRRSMHPILPSTAYRPIRRGLLRAYRRVRIQVTSTLSNSCRLASAVVTVSANAACLQPARCEVRAKGAITS